MQNLLQDLIQLLEKDDRLVVEGRLLKNKVIELSLALDSGLLRLLLSHDGIRRHFFTDVDGLLVFDKIKFQQFVSNKEFLPDSYTAFKNKIGLTAEGNYLTDSKEVVLVWPYKDCVLEGGQTKEDAKRDEIFWNETLAPDEIDRLLAPKVLTNFKRYDKDGAHTVASISKDDNLIIKGNNLLVLHTLKRTYAGQVKLIYIDPPYNTGNDGFNYNDSFNHSTWLTFMRNRLTVAWELLRQQGVILIQCDDNEQAYLKVLADELFGKENFVDTFVWKNTDNAPTLSKKSRKNVEFIHCYEKSIDKTMAYKGRDSDNDDAPLLNTGNPVGILSFPPGSIKCKIADRVYPAKKYDSLELLNAMTVLGGVNQNQVSLKGEFKWGAENLNREMREGTRFVIKTEKMSIRYQRTKASSIAPDKFIDGSYLSKALGIGTNEDARKEILEIEGEFDSYPKPESLVSFFIQAITSLNDLVLDFHLGSGTTAAAAHKLGRRYIGIEQMDYIGSTVVNRLTAVIAGDKRGISSALGWDGGGAFVYAELSKANQYFLAEIKEAKDAAALGKIWQVMQEKAFLSYRVEPSSINAAAADFAALSVDEQKRFLMGVLDKNMLYVPLSEIDDTTYAISDEDKKLNRQFSGQL